MTRADTTPSNLVDIWEESARTVSSLGRRITDEEWALPTPCPGWAVGDVVAHIIDIEQLLSGDPRPVHEPDWGSLPHATGDFGRFTEIGVDVRRGRPRLEVLDELDDVVSRRRVQLDAHPEGEPAIGPMGNPTTMDRLVRMRIFDTWAHERDIRAAIGDDTEWTTSPARIAYEQITGALPIVWAKNAGAPAGSVAVLEVTGPDFAGVFAAVVGDDGKGSACPPAGAAVELAMTWPDLVRRACGRVPAEETARHSSAVLAGDPDLAAALLRALTITP
jgi:uncharacterized protein (TIGR03083 family)